MKRLLTVLIAGMLLFSACSPKPMYKTKAGKKKLKHYNELQFNDRRNR